MLSDFYQIIVHLNTLADHLRDLLQKEVDFDLTGTWNEIIIDSTVYRHQPIWDILAILEKKKKKKKKRKKENGGNKTVSYYSQSLSPTD